MNWGHKITILYTSFAVFILFLVAKTFNHKSELVTGDYYKEELEFQQKLNKLNNAQALTEPLQWKMNKQQLEFVFPSSFKNISITANFMNPSSMAKDKQISFQLDSLATGKIPFENIGKGYYQLNLSWAYEGKEYMKEDKIMIP